MAEQITVVMDVIAKMDNAEAGFKKLQGALQKFKLPDNLDSGFKKSFANIESLFAKYKSQLEKGFETKADISNFVKTSKAIDTELDRLSKHFTELTGKEIDFRVKTDEVKRAEKDIADLALAKEKFGKDTLQLKVEGIKKDELSSVRKALEELQRITKGNTGKAAGNILEGLDTGNIQQVKKGMDDLLHSFRNVKSEAKLTDIKKAFGLDITDVVTKIINTLRGVEGEMDTFNQKTREASDNLQQVKGNQIADAGKKIGEAANECERLRGETQKTTAATQEYARATQSMSQQLGDLQQTTQYFFGLRNMINLLKRGIREAVDVVKELDAAMTETAVVTDYSVGDMWQKLPEYTANANALGATVKDMYEATTLYYQQGLRTEAAMGIANETMKMARIGGLQAADATDKMTAALRGFNMEINETSAQRVNDVYSNLAAKTASNTEELGSAMQRTASIAASAGMSFEGTAAFLAQAIETTREPAENLGTAMKTIVARFTELKKNPLEITEVDGEEVSYNKVDTALQSIGVSLKDANGQFRALDDVFLDISQRWDSLTQTQQRYVATTAAGSRQQSRFIAMMSNYERTMQLMDYANNSAGASNEQFGKTMESLEAKLNKLKNAWNKFLMNIMNDSWTKGIVDGGTKILNIVTTLIDKLSFGQKGIKSVLSLFTAFTALKLTGRGANALIGGLGGLIDPNSSFKEGLRGGALGGQAAKISSPIVKAIYDLIPHIDKAVANEAYKYQQYGNFKEAQRDLRTQLFSGEKSLDKYSFSGIYAAVEKNKLNIEQQNALFKSFPGLKKNMTKALSKMLQEYGTDPQTARNLAQGFKKGKIPFDKALEKSGMLLSFGQKMAQIEKKEGQAAAKKFQRDERQRLSREQRQNILNAGKKEGYTGKELQEYYVNETNKALQSNRYAANKKAEELLNSNQTLTTAERAANTFGRLGGALTSAGMSMQMLGSQVSAVNPLLGTLITKAGGLVSAVGVIPNLISSVIAGGPAIWAITAAITALGLVIYDVQKRANNIKNTAAKVTEAFKDTNKETQDNINSLKQYQEQATTWAKGVDSYGNNINLSDEDYNQYLQAVDKIAKINPSIVQGYNAQGHAIVNINKALSETIELEKKRQEDAFKQYLDPASLDKIVRARNIDNNFQTATLTLKYDKGSLGDWFFGEEGNFGFNLGEWIDKTFDSNLFTKKTAAFTDEVTEIIENLQKDLDTSDLTEFFEPFNINWEKLSKNDSIEIQKFVKNREAIYSAALKQSGGELSNKLADSFTTLDTNAEGFTESINATLEWLSTYVSNSPAFADLSAEIQAGINQSLENIAIQPDLTATEMQSQADILVKKFERLTSTNSQYSEALRIAQDAQTKFANSLDETQYDVDIKPALEKLDALKQAAIQEGTVYGDALAQYLENQIQRIAKFTTEGSIGLTEALNTATDEIAAAEGALDSFNEATKKDFSTAAEGMKGIFDKTTETFKDSYGTEIQKHAEGMGDATFWTGAEALLSGKELDRLTKGKDGYEAAEAVAKKIKGLEPMLREGQEGFDAFTDRVLENADAMDKLAEAGVTYDKESGLITNIPDDQWHNVAEALGISDDLLTSMLNKGRQFADISFMNVEDARKALAASDYTIKGTTAQEGKQQNLYVKESTLRQQLSEAGYVRKEQQDQQIQKLQKEQNVKTLKAADEYKKGSKELTEAFKDMGVKTLPDLIQTLNDTGDFTKDEIQAYAEKAGLMGSQERYDSIYDSIIEAANNPELARQTNLLEQINAQVAALRDNRTGSEAKSEYDKFHKELYGGEGHDTEAQKFGDGLNKEGKQLTAGEYEQTKKDLTESAQLAREQAAIARERAKTETGLEKERWENIAKYYDQDANYIDKLLDRGAKAFEKNQKEIDKQLEANESKRTGKQKETDKREETKKIGQKKAEESYKQRGFGNTDVDNRQILRWGSNPSQNSNFAAAQTWGWNANDLKNSISTYMSSGLTFGQGENAVTLTVTPMLQTPSGTPQVLSQDTVSKYFDQIISQATDSNGKINIDKLFELDKQGLEVEGQQINNLLMGAFTRTGAQEASNALSELEHKLEESKAKAKELEKATGQLNRQEQRTKQQTPKKPETSSAPVVKESKDTGRAQEREIVEKIHVEGQEELAQAEQDLNALKVAASSPFGIYLQMHNPDLAESLGLINQVKEAADEEVGVDITGDASSVVTAGASAVSSIAAIPTKHNTTLTATDNVSSKLSSIGTKIASIARKAASITLGGGAVGINNKIATTILPTFASAAKGKGRLGPKNQGGLTLTGEKGFEIAWLPSENRSSILGVGGPQMVNLPPDAVVYTHEQSKDILKRRGIPAGSHANESASTYKKKYISTSVGGRGGGSTYTSKRSGGKKGGTSNAKKKTNYNNWSIEEVVRFDIDQNLERLTSDLKRITDDIEKDLTKIGKTSNQIADSVQEQIQNLKDSVKYNQDLADSYQRQFDEMLKATAANYKISYTQSNGKSADKMINPADYIYKNEFGTYEVDKDAISKLQAGKKPNANSDRALQESVFKEVSKLLSDYQAGRIKALDEVDNLQKQIEENAKKIVDAYYLWENELTEVYDLSQQIAAQTAMQDRFSSQVALEFTRLSTGFGDTAKSIAVITKANQRNNQTLLQQIQTQKTMIEARERELDAFTTGTDELEKLIVLRNKGVGTGEGEFATQEVKDQAVAAMEQRLKAVETARKYFVGGAPTKNEDGSLTYSIDWDKFNKDALNGQLSEETAKSVKDYFEKLNTANVDYNNAIKENTDAIKAAYDKLKEYQDYIVNFEDTLLQQLDEQLQKEINSAEKLGSTITTSLKDLLDEVKRKLDERRKQEDNAKTERDISQKQQRLAALRADTSGGHQVEIAQLQKEIAEAQQSYGRTLEDQLLDRLQQQGDEAARQRERQIELAQAQLDISNSNNKELVNMWLKDPVKYRDEIKEAWMQAQDYESKGYLAQKQLNDTFNSSFAELVQATEETRASQEGTIATITDVITGFGDTINTQPESQISFQEQVTNALASISTALNAQANPLQDVAFHNTQDGTNKLGTIDKATVEKWKSQGVNREEAKAAGAPNSILDEVYKTPPAPPAPPTPPASPAPTPKPTPTIPTNPYGKTSELKKKITKNSSKNDIKSLQWSLQQLGYYTGAIDGKWSNLTDKAVAAFEKELYGRTGNKKVGPQDKAGLAARGYKTGGLADYTGLAWLDGTPSKPELVLNAKDTQNFLALRDVLSRAIGSTNSVTNSYGGNATYEININVDKLTNDYDVDRVAERVKKIIVKDSGYRNVTQVRNFR